MKPRKTPEGKLQNEMLRVDILSNAAAQTLLVLSRSTVAPRERIAAAQQIIETALARAGASMGSYKFKDNIAINLGLTLDEASELARLLEGRR